MGKCVLVLGAGTGASNNLIRSLRAGDSSLAIVGCHHDRFFLRKSTSDRRFLIPTASDIRFLPALREVIETAGIDLLIPGSDADVAVVARLRDQITCRVLLPSSRTIDTCQDKYTLTSFLRARDLAAPLTVPIGDLGEIEAAFARLNPVDRVWCRMRTGTGSMGATAVRTPEQARGWISYWREMRGVPVTSFTLCEYLPGRDFACQSVWRAGALLGMKACERLAYYGGANRASGMSSTPALAKTVTDPRVYQVCTDAIGALEGQASGVFSIDLKESIHGVPNITEINAGRFFMITNIFDLTGQHNLAAMYVRAALGEAVEPFEVDDAAENHYLVRDLDTLPDIFDEDELFQGVEELAR
jgi:carbamoyl-phosphate synthase large subunit